MLDHKWNPNATKIVIPISDEGPYGGDPATDSDDAQSILEAHNACVMRELFQFHLWLQDLAVALLLSAHI